MPLNAKLNQLVWGGVGVGVGFNADRFGSLMRSGGRI